LCNLPELATFLRNKDTALRDTHGIAWPPKLESRKLEFLAMLKNAEAEAEYDIAVAGGSSSSSLTKPPGWVPPGHRLVPAIAFLDSLRCHPFPIMCDYLRRFVLAEWIARCNDGQPVGGRAEFYPVLSKEDMPTFSPDVPEQKNGVDCGVFVVRFMLDWARAWVRDNFGGRGVTRDLVVRRMGNTITKRWFSLHDIAWQREAMLRYANELHENKALLCAVSVPRTGGFREFVEGEREYMDPQNQLPIGGKRHRPITIYSSIDSKSSSSSSAPMVSQRAKRPRVATGPTETAAVSVAAPPSHSSGRPPAVASAPTRRDSESSSASDSADNSGTSSASDAADDSGTSSASDSADDSRTSSASDSADDSGTSSATDSADDSGTSSASDSADDSGTSSTSDSADDSGTSSASESSSSRG